jgi:hypothetical protein
MRFSVIPLEEKNAWNGVISQMAAYDMYHTQLYHSLNTEGEARLLVFEQSGKGAMALPLIFRDIPGTKWKDATSVYGYAGWIRTNDAISFDGIAQQELENYMKEENVVSVFSRLHPLISGSDDFDKGKVLTLNTTTGIDLSLPPEKQFAAYSASVRRKIRKSILAGMTVELVRDHAGLLNFISIYEAAMKRHQASPNYFFSRSYYERMWENDSFETFILASKLHGEWTGAALFTVCNGIMQYHLGGVVEQYMSYSPMKLLIDEARKIANGKGCTFFHLGGGLGGRDDDLFVFKSRMTTLRYKFKIWQWIVEGEAYESLSKNKKKSEFFPLYRVSNG